MSVVDNLENAVYRAADRYYLNGLKNNNISEQDRRLNRDMKGELANYTRETYRILAICFMLAEGKMSLEDIADVKKDAEKKQKLADLMVRKLMDGDNEYCYRQVILGAHKMADYLEKSGKNEKPALDITREEVICSSCMAILGTNFIQDGKYEAVIKPVEEKMYRDGTLKLSTPRYTEICKNSEARGHKIWEIVQNQAKVRGYADVMNANVDSMVGKCVNLLFFRDSDESALTSLPLEDQRSIGLISGSDFDEEGVDYNAEFHAEMRKLEKYPFLVEMIPKVLSENPYVKLEKCYFDEEGHIVGSDDENATMAYILTGVAHFADQVKEEYNEQLKNADPLKYVKMWQDKINYGYEMRQGRAVRAEKWEKLPENIVTNSLLMSSLDFLEGTYNSLRMNSTGKFDDLVEALREYRDMLEENIGEKCDLEKLYEFRSKLLKVEQKADDYFKYKVATKPGTNEKTAFERLNRMPTLMGELNQELTEIDGAISYMEKENFREKEGERKVSPAETVRIMVDKIYSKEEGSSGRFFEDTYTALYNTTENHGYSKHFRNLMEKLADMESIRKRAIENPNLAYLPRQYRIKLREVKLAAEEYIGYKAPSNPSGVGKERLDRIREMAQVIENDLSDLTRANMGMIDMKSRDTVYYCNNIAESAKQIKASLAGKEEPVSYSEAARMILFSLVEKNVNPGMKSLDLEKALAPYKLAGECRKITRDVSFQAAMKEYKDSGRAFDPDAFFKSYVSKKIEENEAIRAQQKAPKAAEAQKEHKAQEIQNPGL